MAIVLAIVNIHTYRLRGEQIPKYMRHDVSKAKSGENFVNMGVEPHPATNPEEKLNRNL